MEILSGMRPRAKLGLAQFAAHTLHVGSARFFILADSEPSQTRFGGQFEERPSPAPLDASLRRHHRPGR